MQVLFHEHVEARARDEKRLSTFLKSL